MRLFFDMDGVLAIYPEEDLWWQKSGAFLKLQPHSNVIQAVRSLIRDGNEVYVLSSYHKEAPGVVVEKHCWLDIYLPELNSENRIFCWCSVPKNEVIPTGIHKDDILLDDYNQNLWAWQKAGGTAIKLLNGLNHKESWCGESIQANKSPEAIQSRITEIARTLSEKPA